MRKDKIYFLIILLSISCLLTALDPKISIDQYLSDKWTNKDGLPQNIITTIYQTSVGYLWIGTQEGIVRFDGVNMNVFNSNNVSEFNNNIISSIIEDNSENLWIGTFNGLLKYKNDKFKLFSSKDGLNSDMIICLKLDMDGDLWVGTDRGIYKYQDNSFIKHKLPDVNKSNFIKSIIIDENKNILIATKDSLYKLKDGDFNLLKIQRELKSELNILYLDSKKNLWVGTVNKGLFKYSEGKLVRVIENKRLSGNFITSIIEDSQGSLWVGTQNGGLNRIFKNEMNSFLEKDGLYSNSITALYEDKEKNLWIGTSGSGLNQLRDGKVTVYGPSNGLIADNIRTVFEDSRGNIWVGSDKGEVYKKTEETFNTVRGNKLISGNVIRSIMEGTEGNIWIGTIGKGLCLLIDDRIEFFKLNNKLPDKQVYSILRKSDGSMWFGTGSGISRYKNGEIKNYTKEDGIIFNSVRVISEDNDGNIWFAPLGKGLIKFDNKSFKSFTKTDGLGSNIITSIYFDDQNIIWVGTYGGGLSWIKDKVIKTIKAKNGLIHNVIYTILEDDGKLWMSSNNGIFNIDKEEIIKFGEGKIKKVSSIAFNESSGMRNRECNGGNSPAGWKDSQGILWFPTVKGLVKIDPKNIKQDNNFPPLIIEKLIVDGKNIEINQNIKILPGYKRIEFQYTVLTFINPKNIKFKVRLKGSDEDWIDMDLMRRTFYTMIRPGKYTFEVISTNGEGKWNDSPTSLTIELQSFFYETKTFYFIVILFIFLGTFLFIKIRFRNLNRRKNELEKEVKIRTNEIVQKNLKLEKLSIVARETNNAVIITDADGTIVWLNEGFSRIYGYTFEQFINERGNNIINCSFVENFGKVFNKCVKNKKPALYESSNKARDGRIIWMQVAITPIINKNNEVKQVVFVETDIGKLKQAHDKMKMMSVTDPLTKLKNRRYFHNLIIRDVKQSKRTLYKKSKEGLIYSMIFFMVDIDFFKKVNDKYGHNAGDQLLVQLSDRMYKTLRGSDLLVRWGGEEFLIMSKDDNFEGAKQLSIKLLKSIEGNPFILEGLNVDITISIGYCGFPILKNDPNMFKWEDIVNLADSALYIAKNNGRKRSVGINFIEEKLDEKNIDILKNNTHKAIEVGIIEAITSNKNS